MRINWVNILAILVIVAGVAFLFMKRRARRG
jgi:hypothetical protein